MILDRIFKHNKEAAQTVNNKVFCIGFNKTGTTSLGKLFDELGYSVAPQLEGERLLSHWAQGKMDPIINFAGANYDFFQDIPFSLPKTYRALYEAFPKSKFILTVRDNEQQWYDSVIRFHSKLLNTSSTPTAKDLSAFQYIERGWLWSAQQAIYGVNEDDPYDEIKLKGCYRNHIADAKRFFDTTNQTLLVLNLSDQEAPAKLGAFIERQVPYIPWENKS